MTTGNTAVIFLIVWFFAWPVVLWLLVMGLRTIAHGKDAWQ